MPSIYIVRHGESTWNAEHRWAGHADVPLSDLGRQQALQACPDLIKLNFDCVASSALSRAKETAQIIASNLGLTASSRHPEFNERHYGRISGLTSPEIEQRFPGFLEEWRSGKLVEIPGGETLDELTRRVKSGFARLHSCGHDRILLVSHEGIMRVVASLLGEPRAKYKNLQGRWVESSALCESTGDIAKPTAND